MGAVAVCEADPDIVCIGTGETELRGNVQQGDGVYKSTDAGETWDQIIEQDLPQLNELLRVLELEATDITGEGNVPSDP